MKRLLAFIVASVLLASCNADPDAFDWCFEYRFQGSDLGFSIGDGSWVDGVGLATNSEGNLFFTYEGNIQTPNSVTFNVVRYPAGIIENPVDISAFGEVHGVTSSFTASLPSFIIGDQVTFKPTNLGDNSNAVNVSIQASQGIAVSSITVRGLGTSSYPLDWDCNANPSDPTPTDAPPLTGTPAEELTPFTVTPSVSPTPNPSVTAATTSTPIPGVCTLVIDFDDLNTGYSIIAGQGAVVDDGTGNNWLESTVSSTSEVIGIRVDLPSGSVIDRFAMTFRHSDPNNTYVYITTVGFGTLVHVQQMSFTTANQIFTFIQNGMSYDSDANGNQIDIYIQSGTGSGRLNADYLEFRYGCAEPPTGTPTQTPPATNTPTPTADVPTLTPGGNIFCRRWDFEDSNGGWSAYNNGSINLSSYGAGAWRSVNFAGGKANSIVRTFASTLITSIEVNGSTTQTSGGASRNISLNALPVYTGSNTSGPFNWLWVGSANATSIRINANIATGTTGSTQFNRVTVRGTGTNPFGSSNCVESPPTFTPTPLISPTPQATRTAFPTPTNRPPTRTPVFIPSVPPVATIATTTPGPGATSTSGPTVTGTATVVGTAGGGTATVVGTTTPVNDGGKSPSQIEGEEGLPVFGFGVDIGESLFGLLGDWLGQAYGLATGLLNAFFNSTPQAIPGMPLCMTNPIAHDICAIYYIMDWTLFAPNTPGQYIIPLVLIVMNIYIVMYFVRWVLKVIRRGEQVMDVD